MVADRSLSVLTLQFTPIEYRLKIVREAFNALIPGGSLILVEKVLGASADLDAMLVDLYYGMKRGNGYSQEEMVRVAESVIAGVAEVGRPKVVDRPSKECGQDADGIKGFGAALGMDVIKFLR